jgi:hypothetical protein
MSPHKCIKAVVGLVALLLASLLFSYTPAVLALFDNGGFEEGNLTGWTVSSFLNYGLDGDAPFDGGDINRIAGGVNLTSVIGPFPTMSQSDPHTGGNLHFPQSGQYSARINYEGKNRNANSLRQTITASSADSGPDGNIHIQFAWAAVVENPEHDDGKQPYIYISLKNVTKGGIPLYETFMFADDYSSAIPWKIFMLSEEDEYQYTDWQVINGSFTPAQVAVGDSIELEVIAAGCSRTGHWGYVYVDSFGSFIPVTPRITADNKRYDGTTVATIHYSLEGITGGDNVHLSWATADFEDPEVGKGKLVTARGLALKGNDAGKYMLTAFTANTTADIYKTQLAIPPLPPFSEPDFNTGEDSPQPGLAAQSPATSADVTVITASVRPREVIAGEPVIILANVANRGDLDGKFTATLSINGKVESTQELNVPGNHARSIEFTVIKDEPGVYAVDVNGQVAYFTVLERRAGLSGSTILTIVLSIVAALVIARALVLIFRKRFSS